MTLQNIIGANSVTPLLPLQGGSGVSSPLAHGVLIAEGASAFNSLVLTNGQVLIGSTGVDPVPAALTAGTNISIVTGPGSIQINNTLSPAGTTTEVTGTSQSAVVNNNYIANNPSLVTVTLPAAPANVGDFVKVWGKGAGGWSLVAGSGSQVIHFGNIPSSPGGAVNSTQQYDFVEVRVITAGGSAEWSVVDGGSNLDVV